jgi:hypothetical protein
MLPLYVYCREHSGRFLSHRRAFFFLSFHFTYRGSTPPFFLFSFIVSCRTDSALSFFSGSLADLKKTELESLWKQQKPVVIIILWKDKTTQYSSNQQTVANNRDEYDYDVERELRRKELGQVVKK